MHGALYDCMTCVYALLLVNRNDCLRADLVYADNCVVHWKFVIYNLLRSAHNSSVIVFLWRYDDELFIMVRSGGWMRKCYRRLWYLQSNRFDWACRDDISGLVLKLIECVKYIIMAFDCM